MDTERWRPSSEADIESMIKEDLLRETHFLDMKREVEHAPGARKELARDLAQFALDGGSLLIGVSEDKPNRTWKLTPQPLEGFAERVEMIAHALTDPALFVTTHIIPSQQDSTRGYLFVEVPPSPLAPHMVDGAYYARGDKARIRLSDAEVLRHHAARSDMTQIADSLLDEEIARDPLTGADGASNGHLYLIAQPLTAPKDIARGFVHDKPSEVYQLIMSVDEQMDHRLRQYSPSLTHASTSVIRARGVARCSHSLRNGRKFTPDLPSTDADAESVRRAVNSAEARMLDIELGEDGSVRVLVGRMTDTIESQSQEQPIDLIFDGLAVAYSIRLVHWTRTLGERTGYFGSWTFGIAATNLDGLQSALSYNNFRGTWPHYDQPTFRETTFASHTEMRERPHDIVERIVGPLVRGLGSYEAFRDSLEHSHPDHQD